VCDPSDILATARLRAPGSEKPSLFLYERYPGGVGYSEKLYHHAARLLESALALLSGCGCRDGCPSCVGPVLETGVHGKSGALVLARVALGLQAFSAPD